MADREGIAQPLRRLAGLTLIVSFLSAPAYAGGGPQNLFLVVNRRSAASLTIANHYLALRGIPSSNVLYLDWPDAPLETEIEPFREQILRPVLNAIQNRGLASQIDYVAYSADFPYRIDAQKDGSAQKAPLGFGAYGSINSLTYLWGLVLAKQATPMQVEANFYFSRQTDPLSPPPSRAFHLATNWNQQGQPVAANEPGQRFLLSTMLAMTQGRGTSISEAINYLTRGVEADATSPKGTIYFCVTNDVRVTARQPLFNPARLALQKLGVASDLANDVLPRDKKDVQGLVLGASNFDWPHSGSTMLKGAICDNLTSTSGFLHDAGNQTSMCEFLRAGAAGVSGTIVEPLLILQKFPSPFLQVHYARGCSLAESFYQSVHGPFQLLIIGDPLCQPWAKPPDVAVTGVEPNAKISGKLTLNATAKLSEEKTARSFELFIDGRRAATAEPGKPLELETTAVVDGSHELCVAAIDDTPIEVQGRKSFEVTVDNNQHSVTLSAGTAKVKYGQMIDLKTSGSAGTAQIAIFQASRAVAKSDGQAGETKIDSRVLGMGPVRLQAVALDNATPPKALAMSAPIIVTVEPPDPFVPRPPAKGKKTYPGLALTLGSGRRVAIDDTTSLDWLERAGVKKGESYKLTGYVQVPSRDVYQFAFAYLGQFTLTIDGHVVYKETTADQSKPPWWYVPVSLAPGKHKVEISAKIDKFAYLQMRFGGPGALQIGAKQFRHEG